MHVILHADLGCSVDHATDSVTRDNSVDRAARLGLFLKSVMPDEVILHVGLTPAYAPIEVWAYTKQGCVEHWAIRKFWQSLLQNLREIFIKADTNCRDLEHFETRANIAELKKDVKNKCDRLFFVFDREDYLLYTTDTLESAKESLQERYAYRYENVLGESISKEL